MLRRRRPPAPVTIGALTLAALAAAGLGIAALAAGPTGRPAPAGVRSTVVAVQAAADDAEQRSSGTMRLTSRDLELTVDDSTQTIGLRFAPLGVPAGAKIVAAHLELAVAEASSEATSLQIGAEAADSAPPFTEARGDLSARPLAPTRVQWAPRPWLADKTDGGGYDGSTASAGFVAPPAMERSPDLSEVVQDLVDRPGWTPDSAAALLITGRGRRVATAFDDDPTAAPRLVVSYRPPVGAQPEVTIDPASTASVAPGTPARLVATATDAEDGDLSDDIAWTSDRDGPLGTGPALDVVLSAGPHLITAEVADGDGRTRSATLAVTVHSPHPVLLAAGNVASCDSSGDERTAALLDRMPEATVAAVGNLVTRAVTLEAYPDCFGPSWGRSAHRLAVPGNRDAHLPDAAGYRAWVGAAPGTPTWYSTDIGSWHVIGLDTNCEAAGGCGLGSPQGLWLAADLAAHPAACTLVLAHHPRYSSGRSGGDRDLVGLWELLRAHNVDVVLSGHDGDYERFAPQNAYAQPDPGGIRQFVVGTGGADLDPLADPAPNSPAPNSPAPNSEMLDASSLGVLQLELEDGAYTWSFLPVEGAGLRDAGRAPCNTDPPAFAPLEVTIAGPTAESTTGPTAGAPAPPPATIAAAVADPAAVGASKMEVHWISDLDGEVGTGPTLATADLSPGTHRLVAHARRNPTSFGTAALTLTVPGPGGAPPVVATSVATAADDDAEEELDRGAVAIDSVDLELVDDDEPQLVGIRFPGLNVPTGARIVRAWIQLTADSEEAPPADAHLELRAEAIKDAPPFVEVARDVSRRSLTERSVTWDPPTWFDPDDRTDAQRTPDLAPVVQEVVDRPGWSPGNALAVVISGTGTRTATAAGSDRPAATLHVEWVPAG